MKIQVALALISAVFTEALRCYECIKQLPLPCDSSQAVECPHMCNSISTTASLDGVQEERVIRACLPSVFCFSWRLNIGFLRVTINSECCQTDLCNDQALPVLPKQSPNGNKCCANHNCSETVNCEGDEDHCINTAVLPNPVNASLTGCASKSICEGFASIFEHINVTVDIKCCEGNLCNGLSNTAMSINLRFLIMLWSLLTSILFL